MRPSHPVRHFWPLRNQRFFCSRLRSGLLVERLGMQTRLTPLAWRPPRSWPSRSRHPPPPGAACSPALLDAFRSRQAAGPSRWAADRRLRRRRRYWFSASCNLTILPNSVGLPALPFRITSMDGSNRLTILFSAWVSPAKTRAENKIVDRKSTRLNSSHLGISYAVFCLKKKNIRSAPGHRGNGDDEFCLVRDSLVHQRYRNLDSQEAHRSVVSIRLAVRRIHNAYVQTVQ